MKKILLLFLCLVILITTKMAFCEEKADGYLWGKTPKDLKMMLIRGFYEGFRIGFTIGITNEYERVTSEYSLSLKNKECDKECMKTIKEAEELLAGFRGFSALSELYPKDKNLGFYVSEIDSFLEQFSLCKKMDLEWLLFSLADVWTFEGRKKIGYDFIKETSYKKIAEECLKAPK